MSVTRTPDGTYRIEIDVWGDGINDLTCSFQSLITQARIYSALTSFFHKSHVQVHTLTTLKGVNINDAIQKLRRVKSPKVQKSVAYAQKLFENDLEKSLSNAVRELAYKAIEQTINDLKTEITISPASQVEHRVKLVKTTLKRRDRINLELPKLGRRLGSKKQDKKYSKSELYSRLKAHLQRWDSAGDKITKDKAAKALGLSYGKKLQRLLDDYGETRDWRELVEVLLTEAK